MDRRKSGYINRGAPRLMIVFVVLSQDEGASLLIGMMVIVSIIRRPRVSKCWPSAAVIWLALITAALRPSDIRDRVLVHGAGDSLDHEAVRPTESDAL